MTVRLLVCAAITAALAVPASALGWAWPVQGPVLRPFLLGDDPYAAGQHRGIDIGAPAGTPVLAPAAGVVSFTGTVPVGGRTVSLQTEDGYSVTLLHLGSVVVRRGTAVAEGGLVGTVGPSGVVELPVPYVYLGVRRASEPNGYLDPLLLLPGAEVPPVGPPATGDEPSLVVARAPAVVSAGPVAVVPAPGAEPLEVKTGLAPAFAAPRATAARTVARPVPVEAEQSREHGGSASASVSTPGERAVPVRPRERRPAAPREPARPRPHALRTRMSRAPFAASAARAGFISRPAVARAAQERRHDLGLPGQADLRGVRVRGARARPLPALTRAAPGCDRRSGEPEAGSYH